MEVAMLLFLLLTVYPTHGDPIRNTEHEVPEPWSYAAEHSDIQSKRFIDPYSFRGFGLDKRGPGQEERGSYEVEPDSTEELMDLQKRHHHAQPPKRRGYDSRLQYIGLGKRGQENDILSQIDVVLDDIEKNTRNETPNAPRKHKMKRIHSLLSSPRHEAITRTLRGSGRYSIDPVMYWLGIGR